MRASADVVHPAGQTPCLPGVQCSDQLYHEGREYHLNTAHPLTTTVCCTAVMRLCTRAIDIFVVGVGAVQGSAKTACVDPIPTYVSMRGSDPFLL